MIIVVEEETGALVKPVKPNKLKKRDIEEIDEAQPGAFLTTVKHSNHKKVQLFRYECSPFFSIDQDKSPKKRKVWKGWVVVDEDALDTKITVEPLQGGSQESTRSVKV